MSNLELEVRNIIAEVTEKDIKDITPDAHLVDDLGADSMMALEILAALEKKFKMIIPEDSLPKLTSLKKIMGMMDDLMATTKKK